MAVAEKQEPPPEQTAPSVEEPKTADEPKKLTEAEMPVSLSQVLLLLSLF